MSNINSDEDSIPYLSLEEQRIDQITFQKADWLEQEEFAEIGERAENGVLEVFIAPTVDMNSPSSHNRLERLLGLALGANELDGVPLSMEGDHIGAGYSQRAVELRAP